MTQQNMTWEYDIWEMLSPGAKLNYFRDYQNVLVLFPDGKGGKFEKKAIALHAEKSFVDKMNLMQKSMLSKKGIKIIIKEETPEPEEDDLYDIPKTEVVSVSQPNIYEIPEEVESETFGDWLNNKRKEFGF